MGITTLIQKKGGSGKSTLACNLAVCHAMQDKSVLLINTDSNQNIAKTFVLLRDKSRPPIHHLEILGDLKDSNILELKEQYDEIIMDTGGYESVANRSALFFSDLVIVPVIPNYIDLTATLDKEKGSDTLLGKAKACNSKLKTTLLFNKASTHYLYDHASSDVNKAKSYVKQESHNFDYIAKNAIKSRVAYDDAFGLGLGVAEYSDNKAAFEIIHLYKELFL